MSWHWHIIIIILIAWDSMPFSQQPGAIVKLLTVGMPNTTSFKN
jgi:hypothetical protein